MLNCRTMLNLQRELQCLLKQGLGRLDSGYEEYLHRREKGASTYASSGSQTAHLEDVKRKSAILGGRDTETLWLCSVDSPQQ